MLFFENEFWQFFYNIKKYANTELDKNGVTDVFKKECYLKRNECYQQKYNTTKEYGTILENSSTNSNLKLRHLSGNLKGS